MDEISFDQYVFIHIGSRHRHVDRITVVPESPDFTEPNCEISHSIFTIYPVALRAVCGWVIDQKVLNQNMTVLIPMSQLERCWCEKRATRRALRQESSHAL